MTKLTVDEINQRVKKAEATLDGISLERKKLQRMEADLFDLHRKSLRPLREILSLPLSAKDYQTYQDLIQEVDATGSDIENWVEEWKMDLKQKENKLEKTLDYLSTARKKVLTEEKKGQ